MQLSNTAKSVANGFSSLWKNPDINDVYGKMSISFSAARISLACAHRKKAEDRRKEMSAANFSTAKMISFLGILTESLKRNANLGILTEELKVLQESTSLYEPSGNGRKKLVSGQMAISDLRFSGERKPGLIQESCLTFLKRTASFRSLFWGEADFQLNLLQTKTLMLVEVDLKDAPPQSISHSANPSTTPRGWLELNTAPASAPCGLGHLKLWLSSAQFQSYRENFLSSWSCRIQIFHYKSVPISNLSTHCCIISQ